MNRAQARASHTQLVMRTSAPLVMGPWYRLELKKYVLDRNGKWQDANTAADTVYFERTRLNQAAGFLADDPEGLAQLWPRSTCSKTIPDLKAALSMARRMCDA